MTAPGHPQPLIRNEEVLEAIAEEASDRLATTIRQMAAARREYSDTLIRLAGWEADTADTDDQIADGTEADQDDHDHLTIYDRQTAAYTAHARIRSRHAAALEHESDHQHPDDRPDTRRRAAQERTEARRLRHAAFARRPLRPTSNRRENQ